MFRRLIFELEKRGHTVLVTAREKINAVELYREEGLEPYVVGKYSTTLVGKLVESSRRIRAMAKLVTDKLGTLDAVISNTGVEATRVGFGLGAKVHTFHDHPEAVHQLLLALPLSNYVYAPWVIYAGIYKKYVPSSTRIVFYHGFLHVAWMPYVQVDEHVIGKCGLDPSRPVVVFRESETGAAYLFGKQDITVDAVKVLAEEMPFVQFVARPRYNYENLTKAFRGYVNVTIFRKPVDMQSLLAKASLLIGGGATMSLEASYWGTPVVQCRPVSSPIATWLEQQQLAVPAKTLDEAVEKGKILFGKRNVEHARKVHDCLEFPLEKLIQYVETEE